MIGLTPATTSTAQTPGSHRNYTYTIDTTTVDHNGEVIGQPIYTCNCAMAYTKEGIELIIDEMLINP
jgi:hypothetical protein